MDQIASEKEVRLATALKRLPERELAAYRYFVRHGQAPIAQEKAEELFRLYQRGSTCEEIRRLFPTFSLGQVVAARVMLGWDDRREIEVKNLQEEVPARVETAQLETQELLANVLHASNRRFADALKIFIATGDYKQLEAVGFKLPSSPKELKEIVELYMKVSGTDTKKVEVSVKGGLGVKHSVEKVKPEEAEGIMDDLLSDPVDAEFTEVEQPKLQAAPPAVPQPKTREEMVATLVAGGMAQARAEQVVGSLEKKVQQVGAEIASIAGEIANGSKEPMN